MIEISFAVAGIFGLLWAFQLFVILEMLFITRETRSQLHTAVRKLAEELTALRGAYEAHVAGSEAPSRPGNRRRSTDVSDWVTESGVGNGVASRA